MVYELSKLSYQHADDVAHTGTADTTTAASLFGEEITVKGPIEYKLIYKKPAADKFKITLHFVDESGNAIQASQTLSNIPKDTKFKITEKFPTLNSESNYKEITKNGVKYTVATARYKFSGSAAVSKTAKQAISDFFAKQLTMTADLDYYLVYEAEESIKIRLKFIDEDGHEIKPEKTVDVPEGSEGSAKSVFGSDLNVGAYVKITAADGTVFEVESGHYQQGGNSGSCPNAATLDSWLGVTRTFNNDTVFTLYYKGKVEDNSAVIKKCIILEDSDGNTVRQEGPTIVETVDPKNVNKNYYSKGIRG